MMDVREYSGVATIEATHLSTQEVLLAMPQNTLKHQSEFLLVSGHRYLNATWLTL